MQTNPIRYVTGVPTAAAFKSADGSPLVMDKATGDLYVLVGSTVTKISARTSTGWTAATGTASRATFATTTVTTEQLAQRVKALLDDLIAKGVLSA